MKFKRSRKQMTPGMKYCKDAYGGKKSRISSPFNKTSSSSGSYYRPFEDAPTKKMSSMLVEGAGDAEKPAPSKKISPLKNTIRKVQDPIKMNQPKNSGEHSQLVKGAGKVAQGEGDTTGSKEEMFTSFASQTADMNKAAYNTSSVDEWDAAQKEAYAKNKKEYASGGRNINDINFQGGDWIEDFNRG